jgi:Family of unknown function (DUF5312)
MSTGNFFSNFIFAYGPLLGKKQEKKIELRRIISRLNKNDKLLIDPVQMKMRPLFSQLIIELEQICSRLSKVYEGNLSGLDEDILDFETQLASVILEKGNLNVQAMELKVILQSAHAQGQGGINTLDRIFKSRVKYFSHKDFKRGNIFLVRNQIFSDISHFNFSRITEIIPINNAKKPGSLNGEKILQDLKDLYFISSLLPDKSAVINDPVVLKAFEINELESFYTLEKCQSDIHRLIDIFKGPLSAIFLKDVIRLISKGPDLEPDVKEYHSEFPKDIYDQIVEKYRIDREKFMRLENEKLLQSRMNALFKDRTLSGVQVYNAGNSELFYEAGLPAFQYIIPVRIIKSFIMFFYSPQILNVLQEIQLEAEFLNKKQKTEFQEIVEYFEILNEKIKKFEEDLTIPSFSELHQYVEALRNGFLDKKEKNKAREAVRKVNNRADTFIQETFTASINLHGYMTSIVLDINAPTPKLIANAMFLNHKKEDLCKSMEDSVELFNKFIKLLKIFAVHVDSARKSFQESQT